MNLSYKKIILFSLLGVVLFFVTAIVLAVLLIDPNDYKQKIQTELSAATGYNISIPGNIELKLFPKLNLVVSQIKLASKDSKQNLTVDAQKLNLNIKLLSLFSGEPKIGTINIAKAIINTGLKSPPHIFADIALTSSGFKPDQKTELALDFKYTTPDKKVLPINLDTDLLYKKNEKSIHLNKTSFKMSVLSFTGKTDITPEKSGYDIKGSIKSNTFSPRKLAALFGINIPEMQNKNTLNEFAVSSNYKFSNNVLSLDNLKTTLDSTALYGDVQVYIKPEYPVHINLTADQLNVDDYKPVEVATTKDSESGNPLAILAVNLNGKLKVNKFTFNNLKAQDIVLAFDSDKNRRTIKPSARLYGGSTNGTINLGVKNNALTIDGQQTMTQVNMGQLLTDYMQDKLITGISDFKISFKTHGNNADAIVKNMVANGNVKLTDSQLLSIKLARAILKDSKLTKLIKDQSEEKEVTVFDTITASFDIKDAVAQNTDMHAVSKRARITGSGNVNLLQQTLNYTANYIYNKSHIIHFNGVDLDLKDKPIPVYLTGSLSNPQYDVKTKQLFKALSADYKKQKTETSTEKTKQKLEDKKHEIEDKVKSKLKDLFK